MPRLKDKRGDVAVTKEEFERAVLADRGLRNRIKRLEEDRKAHREVIDTYLEENIKPNADGYYFIEINRGGHRFQAVKSPRKKITYREDAMEILVDYDLDDCLEDVRELRIREDLLKQAILEGRVDESILEEITETDITYVLQVYSEGERGFQED